MLQEQFKASRRSGTAGGIANSGIFGMFGSVVTCDSNDTSFFCSLSKLVNIISMFIFLLLIAYIIYMVVAVGIFKAKKPFRLFT